MKRTIRFSVFLLLAAVLAFGVPAFAGQKTPIFSDKQPGGTWVYSDQTNTTGNIWWVDSGSSTGADAAGYGQSPESPCLTLDYAVGLATASNGDKIVVMPGHAENLSSADGVDVDVAGLKIVGLGEGNNRPTFTYTATAGEFVIGAANVTVENIRFVPGISDVIMGISVEAAGDNFTLRNCEFSVPSTATFEFLDAIDLASGADNVTIESCKYRDGSSSACNHFIEAGNGVNVNLHVLKNDVFGRFAVSAVWSDTIDTGCLIQENAISNTITGQHCVEFTTTASGMIVDNRFYGDTFGAILDPGSMYCSGNLASTAIDEAGTPIPAAGDSTDNYIGTNSANNDASTSSVASNADGSVLERQEYAQGELAKLYAAQSGTGGVYYVDDSVSSSGAGTTWATAFKTITEAVTAATAQNCRIFIAPGDYDEGAAIAITVDGTQLIGSNPTNNGYPAMIYSTSASHHLVTVDANNVLIKDLGFVQTKNNYDGIEVAGTATSYKLTIKGCKFDGYGTGEYAIKCDDTQDQPDLTVEDCLFRSWATACIYHNATRALYRNNRLIVADGTTGIQFVPTGANRPDSYIIENFFSAPGTTASGIVFTGTPTEGYFGVIKNYFVGQWSVDIEDQADGVAFGVGNYIADDTGGAQIDTNS